MREPVAALDRHIADSLAGLEVRELREGRAIADLGSGAGFPGLPLAVALSGARFDLVESARRKGAVAERLAEAAGLENVEFVWARAEELGSREYDAVTARAVAGLPVLLEYAAPLLRTGGVLVAWKGARDRGEEGAAASAARVLGMTGPRAVPVKPFEGARDRHLYVSTKTAATPDRFPRRPGMARKRPLG